VCFKYVHVQCLDTQDKWGVEVLCDCKLCSLDVFLEHVLISCLPLDSLLYKYVQRICS
jgi:hypothetical protein